MIDSVALYLARCHFPVRGLGYGKRVGIWLQGCSIHCSGCVVPETWEAKLEHRVELSSLLKKLLPWLTESDGVTISGGEPFDQSEALLALVSALRVLCSGDLLVYSGYPWPKLRQLHRAVLDRCDVIVSEPFRAAQRGNETLIGSSNQQVNLLTPMAESRYRNWSRFEPAFGVAERDGLVHLAGIPRLGQLQSVVDELKKRGWDADLTHVAV